MWGLAAFIPFVERDEGGWFCQESLAKEMRMKKILVLVIALALIGSMAVMAAGSKEGAAGGKGFRVAVSNSFITHSWRTQMVNDLQKAVAYYQGKGLISEFNIQHSGADVQLQANQIRNFINKGVDLLIIDPTSATALNPVIEEAVDAKVLVIISDEPVTSKAPYQLMPTHDVWMEKLADYVFKRLNGKGNVVYLSGIEGAPASDMRDKGFERALARNPGIKLLTKVYGMWDPSRAQQAMADVLAAYPNIDGVVAQDGECLAAIRAFKAANKPLPVINGEGFRPFFEYWTENLDKGFTSYAIANGPGFSMTAALGVGLGMLEGKKLKESVLPKGQKVININHRFEITDKNIKDALAEHTRLRGVEDYIDEVWTEPQVLALFN
jgi:ribose transport system substrate-binding protein